MIHFFRILFRLNQSRKIENECHKKNLNYEILGKATCTQTSYGAKFYIVYTFMVNGYGNRKISIKHNLVNDILDKGDQYKHPMYVKWYKSWENGSLDAIPVDDRTLGKDKLWYKDLNYYYQHYIHDGEIFVRKITVKSIDEMVVSEEIEYK